MRFLITFSGLIALFISNTSYSGQFTNWYDIHMLGCGENFGKQVGQLISNKEKAALFSFHYCECSFLEIRKKYCTNLGVTSCDIDLKDPSDEEKNRTIKKYFEIYKELGVGSGELTKCIATAKEKL